MTCQVKACWCSASAVGWSTIQAIRLGIDIPFAFDKEDQGYGSGCTLMTCSRWRARMLDSMTLFFCRTSLANREIAAEPDQFNVVRSVWGGRSGEWGQLISVKPSTTRERPLGQLITAFIMQPDACIRDTLTSLYSDLVNQSGNYVTAWATSKTCIYLFS